MKIKSESEIQLEIQEYLVSKGFLVTRINTIKNGYRRSYSIANFKKGKCSGFPDILAIKDNKALLIEVKDSKGEQRPAQKNFEKLCNETNNDYYIIRDVNEINNIIH